LRQRCYLNESANDCKNQNCKSHLGNLSDMS
jgi:hypothetical protein